MHTELMEEGDKLGDSSAHVTNGTTANSAETNNGVTPVNSTSSQSVIINIRTGFSVGNSPSSSGNCSSSTSTNYNGCSSLRKFRIGVSVGRQTYPNPSTPVYQGVDLSTSTTNTVLPSPPPAAHHNYCRSNLPSGSYCNTSSTVGNLTVPSNWQVHYSSFQEACSLQKNTTFRTAVIFNKRANESALDLASDNSESKNENGNQQISIERPPIYTTSSTHVLHDSMLHKDKKMKVPAAANTIMRLTGSIGLNSQQAYPLSLQPTPHINMGICKSVLTDAGLKVGQKPTNTHLTEDEVQNTKKILSYYDTVSNSSDQPAIDNSPKEFTTNCSLSSVNRPIPRTSGMVLNSNHNLNLSTTFQSDVNRSDLSSSTQTEVIIQDDSDESNSSQSTLKSPEDSEVVPCKLEESSCGSDENNSRCSDQNISFRSDVKDSSNEDAFMIKKDSSFWTFKALIKDTIEGSVQPKLDKPDIKNLTQQFAAEDETDDCVIVHAAVKDKSEDADVIICCTKWAHNYCGDVVKPKICYESVGGYCKFEESGCPKLHALQHFHWQVKSEDNLWLNLRPEQVIALEKSYCDPNIDEVEVPLLDPSTLDKSFKGLLKLLKGRRKWKAIFDSMILVGVNNLSDSLPIRRLCTETVVDATSIASEEVPVYDWQVKGIRRQWVYLHPEQSSILEKAFHGVVRYGIQIPAVDQSMTALNKFMNGHLKNLLGQKSWTANLDQMILVDQENTTTLSLRRYVTEIAAIGSTPEECLYSWYFKDKRDKWIEYGCMDSTRDAKFQCKTGSKAIEKHYQENRHTTMVIYNDQFNYYLDLMNMEQTNMSTKVKRPMKRRPKPHLKLAGNIDKNSDDFMMLWDHMQPFERVIRILLNPNSVEYQNVSNLFYSCWHGGANFKPQLFSIERVQNPCLWKAFKNKVQDLEVVYNDKDMVNIQMLFHGTKVDYLDNICQENFDWRLHGSNVGHAFGKGTYFSPFSSISYAYCLPKGTLYTQQTPNSYKYMFVAEVAVGQCVVGNSTMVRPPQNPRYASLYDSTVDIMPSPRIVVKYDKQEYYPKYIITIS